MQYFSQASQDIFVLNILNHPSSGFYLEIGAGHPTEINNTYCAEILGWRGISIDNGSCNDIWKEKRKNTFINTDACSLDYSKILRENLAPKLIDYLSIDIDEVTNIALQKIPFEEYEFKIITIEHDIYRNKFLREPQRKYLDNKNYIRVCSDVWHDRLPYEDWYLHKTIYDKNKYPILENKEHSEIIKIYGFEI